MLKVILAFVIVFISFAAAVKIGKDAAQMPDGTVVGAQFRCQGLHCPKWALDVSRFDVLRQINVQWEFNLIELLPLAPTDQRSSNLWTAYNPANRQFTVAVQDYPSEGVDAFFVVQINDDVTSATAIHSNVLLAHPDAIAGNPGKMALSRVMLDQNGDHLVLFNDGTLHKLSLTDRSYTRVANLRDSAALPLTAAITPAHIVNNGILKSVFFDSGAEVSYLVLTDMNKMTVGKAVPIQHYMHMPGNVRPIAAHQIVDVNNNVSKLAVMFAGNYDQIMWVDETTGEQTEIIPDIANRAEGATGVGFMCQASTKDCDTLWLTNAYNPTSNKLYFQAHVTDENDISTLFIYELQFLQNKVTKIYYPYVDPDVNMNFGYSGYQWVHFN